MLDTSPTPVDLDAIHESLPAHYFDCDRFRTYGYGAHQGDCDCTATADIGALIADLRSRASIGPDSERIRELEAENERLRHLAQWVADTYTDEGRDDWWKAWDNADPQKRHRMYVGLACAQ